MKVLSFFSNPSNYFNFSTANEAQNSEDPENTHSAEVPISTGSYTVWTGQQGSHWLNLGNWTKGLPSPNNHAFIPQQPSGHHFPVISTHCEINFTLKNEGILINEGRLIVLEAGFIQNDGLIDNAEGARLDNFGRFNNHGTFLNQGLIDNQHVLINGSIIDNQGSILGENQIIDLQNLESKVGSAEKMFQLLSKQYVG